MCMLETSGIIFRPDSHQKETEGHQMGTKRVSSIAFCLRLEYLVTVSLRGPWRNSFRGLLGTSGNIFGQTATKGEPKDHKGHQKGTTWGAPNIPQSPTTLTTHGGGGKLNRSKNLRFVNKAHCAGCCKTFQTLGAPFYRFCGLGYPFCVFLFWCPSSSVPVVVRWRACGKIQIRLVKEQ